MFSAVPVHADCGLPATAHAENINEVTGLLPEDTRGVLAVDTGDLLSGSSRSEITALLKGEGSDPALNQLFSAVNELAEKVKGVGNIFGLKVEVESVENPRKEAEEHYYNPKHTGLIDLGLKPTYLTDEILAQMVEFVLKHKSKIRKDQIYRKVRWA